MRTLGFKSANLVSELYDDNKTIFTIDDVVRISKIQRKTASKFVFDLIKRKVISRLKGGRYIIIPQELGSIESYIGNWYIAAREIVNSPDYYIGFYSAMKYWGMVDQPVLKTYVATPVRQFPPKGMKDRVIFVFVKKRIIFGINEEWVTKTEKVRVSNIEKTIIDVLTHPEYGGGITEVAKAIWIVKNKLNFKLLLEYAENVKKHTVAKRLGYIIEILNLPCKDIMDKLKCFVSKRYDVFDPVLTRKSIDKNQWRLIDNVGKKQILKIISY